jgi:diguanylate cyclase (GGDEF)-like protein
VLVQFSDLTERKRLEDNLRMLAFQDFLTQLPNRRLLLDRLGHAIRTAKRQNSHIAVLFLDLDNFKALNDEHGHDVGDQLLIAVANRLLRVVRDTDTVARLGGDEFVVLLEGLGVASDKAMENAEIVADKIRETLSAEYIMGGIRHQCSASVGIQLFLGEDDDPDRILKEADMAMYEMKRAGQAAAMISRIALMG